MKRLILKEVDTGLGDNLISFAGWKVIADKLGLKLEMEWGSLLAPLSLKPEFRTQDIPLSAPVITIDRHTYLERDPIPWNLLEDPSVPVVVVKQGWQPLFERLASHASFELSKKDIISLNRRNIWMFFREMTNINAPSLPKVNVDGKQIVGIHLRVGGGIDHIFRNNKSGKSLSNHDEEIIDLALRQTRDCLESEDANYLKNSAFLLISDLPNAIFLERARHAFGSAASFITVPGEAKHIRLDWFSIEDWNKIFLDMLMLASSDKMFLSVNSHFSRIGALMASEENPNFRFWFLELNTPAHEGILEELLFKPRNTIL